MTTNCAIYWDTVLYSFDREGGVTCDAVDSPQKAAEILATRFPRGQISLCYDNRDLQSIIEDNFIDMRRRSGVREAIKQDHPIVASPSSGWGYEKPWQNGGISQGLIYFENGSVLAQLSEELSPLKMSITAAWPLHSLSLSWLSKYYGKDPHNHFTMIITPMGVTFSGVTMQGAQIFHKAQSDRCGQEGLYELWQSNILPWISEFVGVPGGKALGATLDVFYPSDDFVPSRLWSEWDANKSARVKSHAFGSLYQGFNALTNGATSNLIADFPHPTDLNIIAKVGSALSLVLAAIFAINGLNGLSTVKSQVTAIDRQIATVQKDAAAFQNNRAEIERLQEIYGPGVIMTDEGRSALLTTLSSKSNRILGEGMVLQSINITPNNHCILTLLMPYATGKEIAARTKTVVEAIQKAHPDLQIKQESTRIDTVKNTITIDGIYKY